MKPEWLAVIRRLRRVLSDFMWHRKCTCKELAEDGSAHSVQEVLQLSVADALPVFHSVLRKATVSQLNGSPPPSSGALWTQVSILVLHTQTGALNED